MIHVSAADFEGMVSDALDSMPPALLELLDNVVVIVEDRHPTEDLLGLYEGIPLTERDIYGGFELPDRVTIYRIPICEESNTAEEVMNEVRVTVVHELAHHFGIDDDRLTELGWD